MALESRHNVLLDNTDPRKSSSVSVIENEQATNAPVVLPSKTDHPNEKESDKNNETSTLTKIEMIHSISMTHSK